jgi:hypothetical protein
MQDEQKRLANDVRRQAEHAAGTAAWADEGGQSENAPPEHRAVTVSRASDTPPALPGRAGSGRSLPPLMSALRPTEHQFDGLLLPWSWCRCCQRAFVKGTFRRRHVTATARRRSRTMQECPYQDCWGQILRDSRPWASIWQAHPSYPEQPERYVVYAHPSGAGS